MSREQLAGICSLSRKAGMMHTPPESLATRHSLINRIKDLADEASWREFFDAYWQLIYNFARKAGLTDVEAQEVVQETVIRVCRNIAKFKPGKEHGSFKAWLLQQTRWRIADQFEKRQKDSRWTAQSADHARALARENDEKTGTVNSVADPARPELEKTWEAEWESHLLQVATDKVKARVSAKQFQAFDLRVVQGLSAKDAAQALGTTVMAVHMATSRVRRLLKREITRFRASSLAGPQFPSP